MKMLPLWSAEFIFEFMNSEVFNVMKSVWSVHLVLEKMSGASMATELSAHGLRNARTY
jgi:hypothetical protein